MLQLTKIFHFEMAHAIYGYSGACRNIHGHSYELHVTVSGMKTESGYIPAPGFIFDFSEIKKVVMDFIIKTFDHTLVLSHDYIAEHPETFSQKNLVVLEAEPTVENLLIYMQRILSAAMPFTVKLSELKLYETKDSFAKWVKEQA